MAVCYREDVNEGELTRLCYLGGGGVNERVQLACVNEGVLLGGC